MWVWRGCGRCLAPAGGAAPPHVLERVGEREAPLLRRGRPGLSHVITRDRDGVEAHPLGVDEAAHVDRHPQRRLDRIDVRAARDELLQDVVLLRPLKEFIARGTYIY